MNTDTVLHLDDALEAGALYLERTNRWADRYQLAHGESTFFCRDYSAQIEDNPDEGCPHCGFGQPIEDDMED